MKSKNFHIGRKKNPSCLSEKGKRANSTDLHDEMWLQSKKNKLELVYLLQLTSTSSNML